jgi:hypothetical protein
MLLATLCNTCDRVVELVVAFCSVFAEEAGVGRERAELILLVVVFVVDLVGEILGLLGLGITPARARDPIFKALKILPMSPLTRSPAVLLVDPQQLPTSTTRA